VALALVAQTLLIASLLLQRRRRRAAELNLQAQRVQLLHASRLAVAGELTASIAHEINQPLGAILSNADAAEVLVESGRLQRDELLQILADIKRDDLRASEVIKRLRSLLARHDTERRRFDLNEAVKGMAAILRAEALRRTVTVDYVLQASRADVIGDPVQIQQVLINLVLNALDASAEVPEDRRRVRVATADTPNGVQVSVRDSGVGIALADLPHVFDPFFSTKRSGMGLGLSIARSIVEAHGGTIAAASCAPGAEFRIILPLAPATDPARASPTATP
jgi:C4-dicarboxylate-specific signal transduction histidine kinase